MGIRKALEIPRERGKGADVPSSATKVVVQGRFKVQKHNLKAYFLFQKTRCIRELGRRQRG